MWNPIAVREFSALVRDPVFRGRGVPKGDGRPVLLIPGFLAGDWTLRVLDNWLTRGAVGARAGGARGAGRGNRPAAGSAGRAPSGARKACTRCPGTRNGT